MFPRQPYCHRHDFPHFSLLSFLEVSKLILFWPFVKIAKSEMLDLRELLILQHYLLDIIEPKMEAAHFL